MLLYWVHRLWHGNFDAMRFRICYQFPMWLQRLYGGVTWRIKESSKVIYLTFDDSCIPEVTPDLLSLLREWGARATFFCVGDNIRKYPYLFKQIVEEGHSVGNHTYHHIAGLRSTRHTYQREIEETDRLIDSLLDELGKVRTVKLFRPPYGRMRLSQRIQAGKTHKIVLWDLLTHDYNKKYTPEQIMYAIEHYSRDGSIVVFHDSLKSKDNVLSVLPQALQWWHQNGYEVRAL